MSDGKEVKRWETISIDTKIPGTGPDVDGVPRVTVVSASDHDRIVAELKAEVDELKYELSSRTEGLRQTRQDWLDSQKTIARQAKVIEKLREQRDVLIVHAHDDSATKATIQAYRDNLDKAIEQEQGDGV